MNTCRVSADLMAEQIKDDAADVNGAIYDADLERIMDGIESGTDVDYLCDMNNESLIELLTEVHVLAYGTTQMFGDSVDRMANIRSQLEKRWKPWAEQAAQE